MSTKTWLSVETASISQAASVIVVHTKAQTVLFLCHIVFARPKPSAHSYCAFTSVIVTPQRRTPRFPPRQRVTVTLKRILLAYSSLKCISIWGTRQIIKSKCWMQTDKSQSRVIRCHIPASAAASTGICDIVSPSTEICQSWSNTGTLFYYTFNFHRWRWGWIESPPYIIILIIDRNCNFVGLLHHPFWLKLLSALFGIIFQLFNSFLWLRITDEGSIPEMRIWSILLIKSDLKWCLHLSRSLYLYYFCIVI